MGKQGLTPDPAGELTEKSRDLATWGGASAAPVLPLALTSLDAGPEACVHSQPEEVLVLTWLQGKLREPRYGPPRAFLPLSLQLLALALALLDSQPSG